MVNLLVIILLEVITVCYWLGVLITTLKIEYRNKRYSGIISTGIYTSTLAFINKLYEEKEN